MTLILNNEECMADFYISPHGNDSFSGTLPIVSDDGKDGPLLTLEEAKKRVREINEGNIKVLIREGDYFMNETVVFSMEDSGHKNRVIRYEAYPNETPVLTSGINITNWKKVYDYPIGLPKEAENNIWQAAIPEELTTVLTMYDKDIQLTRTHGNFFSNLHS